MSKIRDKLIHVPDTGPCDIDVDAIIEVFDTSVAVSQWRDEYRLVEVDGIKVTIKKEDALRLISECGLTAVPSPIFNSGTTWVLHPLL